MIWLTWRQFRLQAWVAAVAVALLGAAFAATGPALFDLYRDSGLAGCTRGCAQLADNFSAQVETPLRQVLFVIGFGAMYLLPGLIGAFWGAPLVARELEAGTHRLVWNQTVSRRRWLVVKMLGGALATALTAGLIALAVTWWSRPLDQVMGGRISPMLFGARGLAPVGYALFAFALGVAVGMVVRRLLVAMAVTVLLVALAQLVMPFLVREHLVTPVTSTAAFTDGKFKSLSIHPDDSITVTAEPPAERAWVLSNVTYDRDGNEFTGPAEPARCGPRGTPEDCERWLAGLGLQQRITYVPAERFRTLQWREFTLFTSLSIVLSLFCLWWIRRRLA